MNHHLINYSLLESLHIKGKGDVYDHCALLFISVIFTKDKYNDLSVEEAKDLFEKELNFILPASVVQLILNRAQKNYNLFNKKEGRYFPDKEKIVEVSAPFIQEKNIIIERNTKFLESFVTFVKDEYDKVISIDDAQEILNAYLQKYQIEIVDYFSVGQDVEIKGKSVNNHEYLFSTFLRRINKDDKGNFNCFVSQVKGIFLKNYMTSTPLRDNQSNLNNVTFYLDTPLILGLLGFNGDSKQNVIKEMINLCNNLKAKLAIFECTRIEFENILKAWANDLESKNTRNFRDSTLQLLKMKGWDHVFIRNFLSRYQSTFSEFNIKILPNPKYKEDYQIDHEGLKDFLKKKAHNEYSAVDHDIKTIEQVVQIREYKNKLTLKDNVAIFVTTSNFLVSSVNEFFKSEFDKDAAPIITNDIWVTNMCWMLNPNLYPEWPEHLVISNYQAIIHDDDKFWNEFLKRFKTLRDTQKISKEDFEFVRRDNYLKSSLKMLSVTNGMSFNDEHIFELVDRTKKRILKRKDETIISQGNIINSYRGKLGNACNAVSKILKITIQVSIALIIWLVSYLAGKGTEYEAYSHASIIIGLLFSFTGANIKDIGKKMESKLSSFLYRKISKLLEK